MVKKLIIAVTGIILIYFFYPNKKTSIDFDTNSINRNQKCRSIVDSYRGDIINTTFNEELAKNEDLKFVYDELTAINQNASDSMYDFYSYLNQYKELFLLSKSYVNELHSEELKFYMSNYLSEIEKKHLIKSDVVECKMDSIEFHYSKQIQDYIDVLKILVCFNSIKTNQIMPNKLILDNVIVDYESIIDKSRDYLNIE